MRSAPASTGAFPCARFRAHPLPVGANAWCKDFLLSGDFPSSIVQIFFAYSPYQPGRPTPMPTPILAYTQHPKITREAFLAELQWHQDQDKIVQGIYWDNGHGCAVGCAVNSINRLTGKRMLHSTHTNLTEMLGVPIELAQLEDAIFEGLTAAEARTWPMRFSSAIQQGADLSGVWPKFAAWMLREIALPAVGENYPSVRTAIETVIQGIATGWVGMDRDAAGDAARGAARAAAGDAAWGAAYHRMAERLLVLLAEAPVPECAA